MIQTYRRQGAQGSTRAARLRMVPLVACVLALPSPSSGQEATLFFEQAFVLFRVQSTGTGLQQMTPLSINSPVRAIFSDPSTQYVYWIESGSQATVISRMPARGGSREYLVVSHLDEVYLGLDVEETAGQMYWSSSRSGGTILRSNVDGSGVTEILTTAGPSIYAVQVELPYVYWTTDGAMPNDGSIRRAPAAGGTFTEVLSGLAEPRDLAIDSSAGKMYWTEFGGGRIRRANLADGSNAESVAEGLSGPFGLALDLVADRLYWTEASAGVIRRKTLTTGQTQTVITGLDGPGDVDAIPILTTPGFGLGAFAWGSALTFLTGCYVLRKRLRSGDLTFTEPSSEHLMSHELARVLAARIRRIAPLPFLLVGVATAEASEEVPVREVAVFPQCSDPVAGIVALQVDGQIM